MTARDSGAPLIIGLAGRKRSGKDTAASRLIVEHSFVAAASAAPIKRILQHLDPYLVGERMSGTFAQCGEVGRLMESMRSGLRLFLLGEQPSPSLCADMLDILDPVLTPEYPDAPRLVQVLEKAGWDWDRVKDESVPEHAELRRLQQVLGTEAGRKVFGEDVWISRSLEHGLSGVYLYDKAGLVISDVRFDNEASRIRERGGMIIEIVRPDLGDGTDAHASEAGLSAPADHVIVNDGTIEDLHEKIDGLVAELAGR